jgi:hypothetical protein
MSTNASVWRTTKTDTLHTAPLRAATARKAASASLQSGGWVVIQAAGPRTCAASNISEGCRRFDQRLGAVCVEVNGNGRLQGNSDVWARATLVSVGAGKEHRTRLSSLPHSRPHPRLIASTAKGFLAATRTSPVARPPPIAHSCIALVVHRSCPRAIPSQSLLPPVVVYPPRAFLPRPRQDPHVTIQRIAHGHEELRLHTFLALALDIRICHSSLALSPHSTGLAWRPPGRSRPSLAEGTRWEET